jgi:hypothetical protein
MRALRKVDKVDALVLQVEGRVELPFLQHRCRIDGFDSHGRPDSVEMEARRILDPLIQTGAKRENQCVLHAENAK